MTERFRVERNADAHVSPPATYFTIRDTFGLIKCNGAFFTRSAADARCSELNADAKDLETVNA